MPKFLSLKDSLILMVVIVAWGAHGPIIKVGIGEVGPFTLAFLRVVLTSLVFLPFVKKVSREELINLFKVSFVFISLHFIFLYLTLEAININSAAVLGMLNIPIMIILSALFLNERFGLWTVMGICISFSGLIVAFGLPDIQDYPLGAVLCVLTTIVSAIGSLLMKKTEHIPKPTFTFYIFAMAIPFLFVATLLKEGEILETVQNTNLSVVAPSLFYQVVINGYMVALWGHLIGRNRAEFVTPFLLLQVPVAAVVSYFMLGETINDTFLLSSALILGGIGIIHTRRILKVISKKAPL